MLTEHFWISRNTWNPHAQHLEKGNRCSLDFIFVIFYLSSDILHKLRGVDDPDILQKAKHKAPHSIVRADLGVEQPLVFRYPLQLFRSQRELLHQKAGGAEAHLQFHG